MFCRFAGCNLWSGRAGDRGRGAGGCSAWCDTDFVGTDGAGGGRFATADALAAAVGLAKPAREATYKTLAALDEPEALTLLLGQLTAEKEPELRALIAAELGTHRRLAARAALRQALDDGQAAVRQ